MCVLSPYVCIATSLILFVKDMTHFSLVIAFPVHSARTHLAARQVLLTSPLSEIIDTYNTVLGLFREALIREQRRANYILDQLMLLTRIHDDAQSFDHHCSSPPLLLLSLLLLDWYSVVHTALEKSQLAREMQLFYKCISTGETVPVAVNNWILMSLRLPNSDATTLLSPHSGIGYSLSL